MKGILFTELLDMVEQQYGYELIDRVLSRSELSSNGIYTAVGTYPAQEMSTLMQTLVEETQTPPAVLMKAYGHHLFGVFTRNYAHFLESANNAYDFLQQIEGYIHVEVLKLYPDAELPKFETKWLDENSLEMIYRSERRMGPLAQGLIEAALSYYGDEATVAYEPLIPEETEVRFVIARRRGE